MILNFTGWMILGRAAMPPIGPLMAPLTDSNCYTQFHNADEVQNGLDSVIKIVSKVFHIQSFKSMARVSCILCLDYDSEIMMMNRHCWN